MILTLRRYWPPLALVLALLPGLAHAAPRAIPPLTGPVIDEAGLLDRRDVAALSQELAGYPPALQLQIWIVDSLQDEPIENLSIRAVDAWKLGEKGKDRGVLMLIAVKDHAMRIEVGRGLEGDIPDITAGRLVRDILTPAFRQEQYAQGIAYASRQLQRLAHGEDAPTERPRGRRRIGAIELIVLILFLLISGGGPLFGFGRRRRFYGGWGGGSWPRGGGGSWGGGGGGWSGGGGGFGGGGASGKW